MKFLLLSLLVIYIEKPAPSYGASTRIIGGAPTTIHEFPFAAAINVQTSDSRFFCGGTLYSRQYLLTAAQCVDGGVLFTIHLGAVTVADPNGLTLSTSEYISHPEYDPLTLANDIALIKFRMPIEYTDSIQAVNYLAIEPLPQARRVRAIGWGQTSDQSELAEALNAVFVIPMSNTDCSRIYGNQINDNMVCVEGNYNEGACLGDTGGPLIDVYSRYHSVHVGISSFFSSNGCESTDPSGYTRTYPYVAWIQSVTNATEA